MQNNVIETIKDEVKQEFQVERMILFSDAVFAIVITLMAIEIKLPHFEPGKLTEELLISSLIHLLPILFAYAFSFFFVGMVWYKHLKLFGVVRAYNRSLVIHNLVLLFFIGLFPFAASIVSGGQIGSIYRLTIYFVVIMCCIYSLFFLTRYVLITKPSLREENADITELMKHHKKSIPAVILFPFVLILVVSTYVFIDDKNLKSLSTLWIMIIPISQLIQKRIEKNRSNKLVAEREINH